VLVVGHQDQIVGIAHQAAVIESGVGSRHVDRHQQLARMHHRIQLGHEALEVGLRLGGNVLEVDADAGIAMRFDKGENLLDRSLARCRIGEHAPQFGAFPLMAVPVVDQRYQRQVGSAGANVVGNVCGAQRIVLA